MLIYILTQDKTQTLPFLQRDELKVKDNKIVIRKETPVHEKYIMPGAHTHNIELYYKEEDFEIVVGEYKDIDEAKKVIGMFTQFITGNHEYTNEEGKVIMAFTPACVVFPMPDIEKGDVE